MALTEKQRVFCEEYMKDRNATKAAIRAGYSEKSAYHIGAELLHKSTVKNYLDSLKQQQTERIQLEADNILTTLSEIAFDRENIRVRDRLKALELLGKHFGLFDKPAAGDTQQQEALAKIDKAIDKMMNGGAEV